MLDSFCRATSEISITCDLSNHRVYTVLRMISPDDEDDDEHLIDARFPRFIFILELCKLQELNLSQ